MSIETLMRGMTMKCCGCGAAVPPGGDIEACGCWDKCSCGWTAKRGEPCNNPETTRCSTKVAHGVYNRRTKRYEPPHPLADSRSNEP